MKFHYELKRSEIHVGGEVIQLECIADLNRTIDEWFAAFAESDAANLPEREKLEALCPYFGVVWASARALCEALGDFRSEIARSRVLEVGCGLALPSLYCAKLGADVTATDFHPEVPKFLERNIELNGSRALRYFAHDWKSDDSTLGTYDWVIGSDILYESQHPAPVARALARHCAPGGRIVLADPARPYLQKFSDEMRALGFVEDQRIIRVPDEPEPKDVFILNYRRA
jgi:predicted nicotinamide N-methyase